MARCAVPLALLKRALSLTRRLLDIEPFDESLNALLLKATLAVEGERAARIAFRRVRERFEDEIGEVPPVLLAFGAELPRVN